MNIALVLSAGAAFIAISILTLPALKNYLKRPDEGRSSGKEPPQPSSDSESSPSERNNGSMHTIAAWVAVIGIVAAIALMALGAYQTNSTPNDAATKPPSRRSLSPDSAGASTTNTESAPDPLGSGETTPVPFPDYASPPIPKDQEPANTPPPATSGQGVIFRAPMLKFMPLSLALGGSHPNGTFDIRNDGNSDLVFSLTTTNKLISVSPSSGKLHTDEIATITVTAAGGGGVIINSNGGYDVVKVSYSP